VAIGAASGYREAGGHAARPGSLRAIAEAKQQSEEERIDWALRNSPGERILPGFELGREIAWTPARLAEADAQADGQMELARRRIARA
jgi:hypothetical protein